MDTRLQPRSLPLLFCTWSLALSLPTLGLPARAEAPEGRYTIEDQGTTTVADDTVRDHRTGLTWQRGIPSNISSCGANSCTASEAADYCANLDIDGGGFRLPKISELLTIVDPTRTNPSIDPGAFPGTPAEWFWSSTIDKNMAGWGWFVSFGDGSSDSGLFNAELRVRCVK